LGIIFGIKGQMSKDFSGNLKATGVFHVLTASGMNATLIGGFVRGVGSDKSGAMEEMRDLVIAENNVKASK
jgi:hypothetical protein